MSKSIKQINSEFIEIQKEGFKCYYRIKDIFYFSYNEYKETKDWRIWVGRAPFIGSPDYISFNNKEEAQKFLDDLITIINNYYKERC